MYHQVSGQIKITTTNSVNVENANVISSAHHVHLGISMSLCEGERLSQRTTALYETLSVPK
jgi:hypothetical protein